MDTLHSVFVFLAYTAAVGFLVFGLDDLFFDLQFLRALRRKEKESPVTLEALKNEPEKRIAIFVPAWMEGGVVDRMAEYARRILIYDRFDIFVGVYPNDEETNNCVDALCARVGRIKKAIVPHPGPTSKADCLNAIFEQMRRQEITGRMRYEIVALHDAEDVLHPLTLKVYNHHVPDRLDMAQIPVFPLELPPLRYWVGNSYADEFAEWHAKDMHSREAIGGVVPSAGVGTAFSRRALEFLALKHDGGPFRNGQLAEDYMVGLELCRAGYRTGFIDHPVEREARKDEGSPRRILERVAVREHFPTRFRDAVRQKARWIMGTAFQGWEHGGWWGSPTVRYTLLRDRRAPVVHVLNAAGYCVLGYAAFEWIVQSTNLRNSVYLRPLFEQGSLLWRIVLVDTVLLGYRVAQKVGCVTDVYGPRQGIMAIPRYPVASAVNLGATARAAWLYGAHRIFNRPLAWSKTRHDFPGAEALEEFHGSIEDLLVEQGYVDRDKLDDALRQAHGRSAPRTLLEMHLLDEDEFLQVWARHSGLPARTTRLRGLDPGIVDTWPEKTALRLGAMPLEIDGRAICGFSEPPAENVIAECEKILACPVEPVLLRPSNLQGVREFIYPRRQATIWTREAWDGILAALAEETRRRVEEDAACHLRSIGESLTIAGGVDVAQLREAMADWCGVVPADLTRSTLSVSLAKALGGVFCEMQRIIPRSDGTMAIAAPLPTELKAHIADILGDGLEFVTDTPEQLQKEWSTLLRLRLGEEEFAEALTASGEISTEQFRRVMEMRRLIASPVDALLEQLGLIGREQALRALKRSSKLPAARPAPGDTNEMLAPGFTERTGARVLEPQSDGLVMIIERLLAEDDLREIHRRCGHAPLIFKIP